MMRGRLGRDQRGFILTLPIILIAGVLALFGFSAMAAIDWRFLLAMMAMGIVGMAFVGVLFFKADFKLVIVAALVSLMIVFIVEVTFPVIVGGLIAVAAMWNFKLLAKRPLMLFALIGVGLLVMVWGSYAILAPMGIVP